MRSIRMKQHTKAQAKLDRIRLMSSELEIERQLAIDRTRSIDSKSAFLVVAGGLLATQTFPKLTSHHQLDMALSLALLPLVLALAVTLVASMALWPLKLKEVEPDKFIRRWIDSTEPASALEDYILELRARTISFRNEKNEGRARLMKFGFILLVIGIVAAIVAGVVQAS